MAYVKARKGKRRTKDEHVFEVDEFRNLYFLTLEVMRMMYKPSRGIAFVVFKPVIREIFAAPFRDRIVHHWLYNNVYTWWDRRFIHDSYSCRVRKGPLVGIKRMQLMEKRARAKWPGERLFIRKFDVKGYFMSLPRDKLFERIKWGLLKQFGTLKTKWVKLLLSAWAAVIFDDPTKGVRLRGKRSDWAKVPKSKSLFYQPKGYGIVIGNLSSQLLSNIYMDMFDRFTKFQLGYEFYGRYVDDFFVIVPESKMAELELDTRIMRDYLMGMELKMHPNKVKTYRVENGVPFLGYVVFSNRFYPGKRLRANFRKACFRFFNGRVDESTIVSYLGFMKHANSGAIVARTMRYVGMI